MGIFNQILLLTNISSPIFQNLSQIDFKNGNERMKQRQ